MSQDVEIFFAVAPDNTIEGVILPRKGGEPLPQQIAFGYRLVGARAVMDPTVSEQWDAVVVCSPEFAAAHRATPSKTRPSGVKLNFLGDAA